MASEKVVILTKDSFEAEVINSNTPVLVDFWAQWCGPCKMVAPVLDELSLEMEGKVKIAKVNVDDESELASKFKVMSIPTMVLFKNGQVVEKIIGARSKNELIEFVQKNA